MIYVSPSLLAADFSRLSDEIKRVENAGADFLHLDIMDGHFVPNISFGSGLISSIRSTTSMIFDVHLMISDPLKYADDFINAGADIITFHYEAVSDPMPVIRHFEKKYIKKGMVISPRTPAEVLFPYLSMLDMVLVMTVEPGFGGQKFMPEMLEKVRKLRRYADEHNISIDIEVDGGLNAENTASAVYAGANVIVAGSAVFKAKKPREVISTMRKNAALHPYTKQ